MTVPSIWNGCLVHPHYDRFNTVRELARGQGNIEGVDGGESRGIKGREGG